MKSKNRYTGRKNTGAKMTVFVIAALAALVLAYSKVNAAEGAYSIAEEYTQKMDTAHEIAELAREVGLEEDNPIILEAQRIWWKAFHDYERDRDIIATVVYNEAWGGCSERHRELVAAVVCNRVKSELFPDTVYAVVTQKDQYNPRYVDADSLYGKNAREYPEVWKTCQEIAARAMSGEVNCPESVLFQAEFTQGTGIYETHCTNYSTTYFCYG